MHQVIELRILRQLIPREAMRKVERALSVRPKARPQPDGDQLVLWLDGRPWRLVYVTTQPQYLCIGCGKVPTVKKHSYCRRCRRRVESGIPVDVDDVVTQKEAKAHGFVSNPGRRI